MNKSMRTLFVALSITGLAAGILSGCGSSTANNAEPKGKVYYLNFKTDTQDDWELLGEQYTKETGVPVSVQTAASGTYDSTLKSEFSKSEPPTLFQINGPVGQSVWKDYTADLTDTELYKQLKNPDLALKSPDGSKVVAVPYAMETYGLIYNKDIMNKYTSLPDAKVSSADDIDSFDTLKAVADDMQSRKDQLGIKGCVHFDRLRFKLRLAIQDASDEHGPVL